MDSSEFDKYSGKFQSSDIIINLKIFHNRVKKYYIEKYSKNKDIVVDVGSGRGSDLKHWIEYKIKKVIGIEPSIESMKIAIGRYIQAQRADDRGVQAQRQNQQNVPRIQYLNGVGNKLWRNGSASLRQEDNKRFIDIFKSIKGKVESMHLFWTIHYMMDTREDFKNILINIKSTLKHDGTVTILCMDGERINNLFKKNKGSYVIKNNDKIILQLDPLYDYNGNRTKRRFGHLINVNLTGTYGLEKGIKENIVDIKYLIRVMEKNGFTLLEKTNFLDVPIPERHTLRSYEEPVSALYYAIIFKKK